MINESILIESPSARNSQLVEISHDKAEDILTKIKALYFALWKGVEVTTTQPIALYYEVSEDNIRQLLKSHKSEFETDGLKTLRGKALRDARDLLSLPSRTSQVTIWTPRSNAAKI